MTKTTRGAVMVVLAAGVVGSVLSGQGRGAAAPPADQATQGTSAPAGGARAPGGRAGGRGGYTPTVWLPDDQFLRWPVNEAAYADIDGFKIKSRVSEVTAISRKSRDDGNQYWGRIAGTPYDRMAAEWVMAQFTHAGLEQVHMQEFELPVQWFPTSWDVTVKGAAATVPVKTAFPLYASVGTKGGQTVSLDPVWVGTGFSADFAGRDVKGKAAVVYGFPNPGGREDSAITFGAVRHAEEAGAAAVIIVLGIPGNVMNEPAGGATVAPAGIPVFVIGNQDGTAIREMIEKNEAPKIDVRMTVEMKTGLKSASVFGVLPGTGDEHVALMAHTDCFFEGAMDNASGMATIVALAEHYAKTPKAQRRRNMVFFTTSAHHSPSGPGGGIQWVKTNMKSTFDKTAVLLNAEHTAQVATYLVGGTLYASNFVSARRWFVGGSDQLKAIVDKVFKQYGMALYSTPEPRPGGELSQMYTMAPSFHIIDHTVYHTDLDTLKAVPAYGLEQSARAFAKIIDEVNTLPLAQLRVNIPQ